MLIDFIAATYWTIVSNIDTFRYWAGNLLARIKKGEK